MSLRRLQARVSTVEKIGVAALPGHELRFHKFGQDDSGKCDAFETGDTKHTIWGVVYKLANAAKPVLDKYEGLGRGYNEKKIILQLNGKSISTFTYYATNINVSLKPFHWYREHVLRGARENRLPEAYIKMITEVESIADHNMARHEQELAIYDSSIAQPGKNFCRRRG